MKDRRHFTAEQKAAVVLSHLKDQRPVSTVCEQYQINPNLFYRWQAEFLANAAAAFQKTDPQLQKAEQRRTHVLEEQLQKKDSIIAYVTTELMKSKKKNGEI